MKCKHINSVRNAVIKSASIEIEDHGFLTMNITVDYGGSGQGMGGLALWADGWEKLPCSNFAGQYIYNILTAVGAKSVSELIGKTVRIDGSYSHIDGIGHIIDDNFFYPDAK